MMTSNNNGSSAIERVPSFATTICLYHSAEYAFLSITAKSEHLTQGFLLRAHWPCSMLSRFVASESSSSSFFLASLGFCQSVFPPLCSSWYFPVSGGLLPSSTRFC